jgi:hypothetical protein
VKNSSPYSNGKVFISTYQSIGIGKFCCSVNKHLMISHVSCFTAALILCLSLCSLRILGQDATLRESLPDSAYRVVVAGPQYKASPFHKKFLGRHYREEWTTPVKVKVVSLDTLLGGLKPVRSGGRQQSSVLHLEDNNGKPYVLRSIDKSYSGSLPEILKGTIIEEWANDQVSTGHPYAAVTVPLLAEAAGVYHTWPQIIYVPRQPALDSFNEQYGDALYLLEERPDGDQSGSPHFGFSKEVISTNELFHRVNSNHVNIVDQKSFARARLFDMLIGDWGRHEDQWRWASFEQADEIIYKPIPRDRDQVYTLFDGLLVSIATSADPLENLQSFDSTIKDIEEYNAQPRHLDRRFTNQLTWENWQAIATDLQRSLTDSIIEKAVHQLPPEIFPISGPVIIAKLKGRRDRLLEFAREYYDFLARDVDIPGTLLRERFEVRPVEGTKAQLSIFRLDSLGYPSSQPYYTRVFIPHETKEIRLYGLGGEDQYIVDRHINDDFLVRIIGGIGVDSFAKIPSGLKESGDITVYDDKEDIAKVPRGLKRRPSRNIYTHFYDYRAFAYDAKGTVKSFMYNRRDRFYLRFGYQIQRQHWRKYPFGFDHKLYANYSISQGDYSIGYEGIFTQFPGNWNLLLNANYDRVVDTHFFGIGNETVRETSDNNYYDLRRNDFVASAGLGNNFLFHHRIAVYGYYNFVDLLIDKEGFIKDHLSAFNPRSFERKHYVGAEAEYGYEKLDNPVVPTKGMGFTAAVRYAHNLKEKDKDFTRYSASAGVYIPLIRNISLGLKAGGATVEGNPEFFQLNELGGSRLLRGYVRERFFGKTSFYNGNELQWIRDFKSYFWNGKLGLFAHFDQGRVWQPGENSSKWHRGYGGGLIMVPFNKMAFSASYSLSAEDRVIHVRVGKFF